MPQDYDELANYVRSRADDPIGLAKWFTQWAWTSLRPAGHGEEPTRVEDVPVFLNAGCGWRSLLMRALFEEIGIESRQVNFYNVPFQGSHTAVELMIDGEWMFFDPSFGLFFENEGGGHPLSIEETRANWPDIVVQKSTLTGWVGQFFDPATVDENAHAELLGALMYQPLDLFGRDDLVGGETNSLFFGPETEYYYDDFTRAPLAQSNHTWRRFDDISGQSLYITFLNQYDPEGRLDTQHLLYDNLGHRFTDWDQRGEFDWSTITTYINHDSALDRAIILYDDGSRCVRDYDELLAYSWLEKSTFYDSSNQPTEQFGIYDTGGSWRTTWDAASMQDWAFITDVADANGRDLYSYIQLDTGYIRRITYQYDGDAQVAQTVATYTADGQLINQAYDALASYVRSRADDPVGLAKWFTQWAWTSLLPSGRGEDPTSSEDVPEVLNASCGWRALLMIELFNEIGIEGRQVNFYNVPFQGNHTALELKIDGKWMFFDPTFGLFFEGEGGGDPLSIEVARANWPDISVQKSMLTGWVGQFFDPESVDETAYAELQGALMFVPFDLYDRGDIGGGEVNSLFFGPEAGYWLTPTNTPLPDSGYHWLRVNDTFGQSWDTYLNQYDSEGRLDTQYLRFDGLAGYRFTDWDQRAEFDWSTITTHIYGVSTLDRIIVIYDDGSRLVQEYDELRTYSWTEKTTLYNISNQPTEQFGTYDAGGSWRTIWDVASVQDWTFMTEVADANGRDLYSYIQLDTGYIRRITYQYDGDSQVAQTVATYTADGQLVSTEDRFVFTPGTIDNDVVLDFQGAGQEGGDELWFHGFGAPEDMSITNISNGAETDWWQITNIVTGESEQFRLVGVHDLAPGDYFFIGSP